MTDASIARVHYFARQFLGTQDFEAEQQYHLAMRRRHNIAMHRWGIVAGLELYRDDENKLWLLPGMAIDGYGREIILQNIQPLDERAFDDKGSDTLDVLIEYELLDSDLRSQRFRDCDVDDPTSFYRAQEQPLIRLAKPNPNPTDRRKPDTVPSGDLAFEPFRAPPDDPQRDWPVFLGQISREQQKPGQPYTYSFNHDNRPYVGLVGAQVVAPSGLARIELGPDEPDDPRRLGVFVRQNPPTNANDIADTLALAIDRAGALDINGATTVHGKLTLDKSAIEFRAGVVNKAARSWQLYYIDAETQDAAAQQDDAKLLNAAEVQNAGKPAVSHELRIEVPAGEQNRVVIGAWSADDKEFKPCLTIAANNKVTVHGDLIVNGKLTETQKRPDTQANQRVQDIILGNALGALGTTLAPLAGARLQTESDVDLLNRMLGSDGGREIVAEALVTDRQFEAVVDKLLVKSPNIMVDLVIKNDSAISRLADQLPNLVNKTLLQQVLKQVLVKKAGRDAILIAFAEPEVTAGHRTAFVTAVLANSTVQAELSKIKKAPTALVDALVAAAPNLVIKQALAKPEHQQVVADLLLLVSEKPTDGYKAVAKALFDTRQVDTRIEALVQALTEEQWKESAKKLLDQLRAVLEAPPPPPPPPVT